MWALSKPSEAQGLKNTMETLGYYDRSRRMMPINCKEEMWIGVPVTSMPSHIQSTLLIHWQGTEKKQSFMELLRKEFPNAILPLKWEKYNDFLLLTQDCTHDEAMYQRLAKEFKVTHIALSSRIKGNDALRRPQVTPLWGDWQGFSSQSVFTETFWAKTKQNGIWYTWAPLYTMFSAGNISEKIRVASDPVFDACGKVVVDLYAGIGYFTLPYAIHRDASVVHACELNPWSVEGLERGLSLNNVCYSVFPKINGKVIVYAGNNQDAVPHFENTADHVNLGLLPSSYQGYPLAIRSLKHSGGVMHVHENVLLGQEMEFITELLKTIQTMAMSIRGTAYNAVLIQKERVKSYSKGVYHWVFSIKIQPGY